MEDENKQPTNGGSTEIIINFGMTGIEGKNLVFPPKTACTKKGIKEGEQTISIKLVDDRELYEDRENE